MYKITKSIRFKLLPVESSLIEVEINTLNQQKKGEFNLKKFNSVLDAFLNKFEEYVFYHVNTDESVVKKSIFIKKSWLRLYAKQEISGIKLKKELTIREIKCIGSKLENLYENLYTILAELKESEDSRYNERSRDAKIGLLIKKISSREILPSAIKFIESSNDKIDTQNLKGQLMALSKVLDNELLLGIEKYLPEQSRGIPIAKASFNYYTINKKPIDYAEKIKLEMKKLEVNLDDLLKKSNKLSKKTKELIKDNVVAMSNTERLFLGENPLGNDGNYASLRDIFKSILAEQKKIFSEIMQKVNVNFEKDIKNNFEIYLFSSIEEKDFLEYKRKTKEISDLSYNKNKCSIENSKRSFESKIRNLKKERGALLNASDKRTTNYFKDYKGFSEIYKQVARSHGRVFSSLKGIEREMVESQLLKWWALIVKKGKNCYLVLVPKTNAGECKRVLEQNKITAEVDDSSIFWFESITLRSLRKLCFGNIDLDLTEKRDTYKMNTFYPNVIKELSSNEYEAQPYRIKGCVKRKIYGKYLFGEYQLTEKGKISFYKDVLSSDYARSSLSLPWDEVEEEVISKEFETLSDFQIALEKTCYLRNVAFFDNVFEKIKEFNGQILKISSLDLESSTEKKFKKHTILWTEFWSKKNVENNFGIRLNPEISLTYRRPYRSRIDKYGKDSKLYDVNKKNRYLYPQITLICTISENSNSITRDLAFVGDEEFKKNIDEFNFNFKKEDIKYSIGIDNGEVELSTLGIYVPEFNHPNQNDKLRKLNDLEQHGFDVLTIKNLYYSEKDLNGNEKKIIQNPSYFLDIKKYMRVFGKSKEEYEKMFSKLFEKKKMLTLDLSSAKVICGKIVTNGAIPTLFNLWMRHAQRIIWGMNDHTKSKTAKKIIIKDNLELNWKDKNKFIEYLNSGNKRFNNLSNEDREEYTKWNFDDWDGRNSSLSNEKINEFKKIRNEQRVGKYSKYILFATSYIGDSLKLVVDVFDVRNVFKTRKEFYVLKSEDEIKKELERYNLSETHQRISNEELDMKINLLKESLVANAIGVIDYLYNEYMNRLKGKGTIFKEEFDNKKVEKDLEKFSGNIYRILERKLYQRFQNYGFVPSMKNIYSIRENKKIDSQDKRTILRMGIVGFVNPEGTSQQCPLCENPNSLEHTGKCRTCGFSFKGIMHSNDGIAGYNIAKRGFENFDNYIKLAEQQTDKVSYGKPN